MSDHVKSTPSIVEKVLMEVRSGLVSSVVAEALLFPLDVVKLRQQVYGGSALSILRGVVRDQGFRGLYQGLFGRLIQTITSNVGFFIWQTIIMQTAINRLNSHETVEPDGAPPKLSTGASLLLNMLAQQINRLITTPIDVVANVNQSDPKSKGFFHTFVHLAQTGGRATLWRGIDIALLLSFNPALMFTLVGKLTAALANVRGVTVGGLNATDLFWISGISKFIATFVTYPLIRAKAVVQSVTSGQPAPLFATLAKIAKNDGLPGLYQGVWILSYKTVLFNSLMMALKQKLSALDRRRHIERLSVVGESIWRQQVSQLRGREAPWDAVADGKTVVYIDGSWSFLHEAQQHVLREASRRGDHLIVGVHSDLIHFEAMGAYPKECYAERLARIRQHPLVSSVVEDAPWHVATQFIKELGICKVVSGSIPKMADCTPLSPQASSKRNLQSNPQSADELLHDPYADARRMSVFEEVPSLNDTTEHGVWVEAVRKVLFSNVDASIDWRILVKEEPFVRASSC